MSSNTSCLANCKCRFFPLKFSLHTAVDFTIFSQYNSEKVYFNSDSKYVIYAHSEVIQTLLTWLNAVKLFLNGFLCGGQHQVPHIEDLHCGHGVLVYLHLWLRPVHRDSVPPKLDPPCAMEACHWHQTVRMESCDSAMEKRSDESCLPQDRVPLTAHLTTMHEIFG